jgi:phosphoenolpyruvate carboxykinase (GTP)
VQSIKSEEWKREILSQEDLFMQLYSHLPKELVFQRELLMARL